MHLLGRYQDGWNLKSRGRLRSTEDGRGPTGWPPSQFDLLMEPQPRSSHYLPKPQRLCELRGTAAGLQGRCEDQEGGMGVVSSVSGMLPAHGKWGSYPTATTR